LTSPKRAYIDVERNLTAAKAPDELTGRVVAPSAGCPDLGT